MSSLAYPRPQAIYLPVRGIAGWGLELIIIKQKKLVAQQQLPNTANYSSEVWI